MRSLTWDETYTQVTPIASRASRTERKRERNLRGGAKGRREGEKKLTSRESDDVHGEENKLVSWMSEDLSRAMTDQLRRKKKQSVNESDLRENEVQLRRLSLPDDHPLSQVAILRPTLPLLLNLSGSKKPFSARL